VSRIEGTVTVEAAADINGNIKVLRIVKGLGYGLDEKAVLALRDWKFAPDGAPVAVITQIDIDFRLPDPGGVFKIPGGGFVQPPLVLQRIDPQYTDEARAAGYQGTVVVEGTVKPDGTLEVLRIVQGLDYGLTEKALEALKQWKFRPLVRNGQVVPVSMNVEVNFNLKK
jgi:TonB family protein